MAGYGSPHSGSNGDGDNSLQTMMARMQAAQNVQAQNQPHGDGPNAAHEIFARYNGYGQGNSNPHSYYGSPSIDSPMTASDDLFPPPAPTPPSNFTSHSHHHSGLSNLGPIGSMPSTGNKMEQSNSLLSLLKFNRGDAADGSGATRAPAPPNTHAAPQSPPASFDGAINVSNSIQPTIHAPIPMPADPQGLLATLMKGNMQNEGAAPESQKSAQWHSTAPSDQTQSYLLNLLNRPKPAQHDEPQAAEAHQSANLTPPSFHSPAGHASDNFHIRSPLPEQAGNFQSMSSAPYSAGHQTRFDYSSPGSQPGSARKTKFDHANPFEDLATRGSRNGTPRSGTSGTGHAPSAPAVHVLKKASSTASSPGTQQDVRAHGGHRSQITSPLYHQHIDAFTSDNPDVASNGHGLEGDSLEQNKETVSHAINELAEKVSREAQEALNSAVHEEEARAEIADVVENIVASEVDVGIQEAAEDIERELKRQENEGILEQRYSPDTAQQIREMAADSAHGPIADSWESAEAEGDEIVVIEDEPNPITVHNFPMKPWISLTMLDKDEPRPEFRDEVVLDIARLKKDFDQIDRNLVSATECYMAYGMSKAGGLRVIRQEDGKDAKLFTDTKDRIFNVAMSSTPSDLLNATQREIIIGTGVSGTVYYVQIKNGEKDHLEEAHPEQYGFALSPIGAQEGDAPGGVLKTRARISSTRPEYFAVGRGKTISIIWPAYIMQNNLFKAGHDRVVDTEKLSKQCALKINTGKAGKDFTFSQDDTTIVSLDKSGRVKFWDVRDLTAAAENSDPRFPMPAHTNIEVKEPLMTLNTTPEGEKAWPTSVLLLDKQRPYQKRCALRYMIVGMKQNHTLQLWDLALGKPVQEFNLPHSKESDAVCSVMYHPASGMITVGHPTRNSVYFLHLSAPKYTVKGLSQVDYVQKLVAKDPSIPEPDSTAVISGVREYSLSNKGILRSLDILVNPAATSDSDEPTLFELYAMHSKGVTCIWVKQAELGWSKENKVISGVDAAEAGLVKITKLKELPNAVVLDPPPAEEPTPLPVRIAARGSSKETPPPQAPSAPSQEQPKKEAGPSAGLGERKEGDLPSAPNTQLDKSEKKARKKREKAAAAAEKNANENQANGGSGSAKNADGKANAAMSFPGFAPESVQAAVKQIEVSLSSSLSGLGAELKDHRGKIETELQKREDSFNSSQQQLLGLVSSVLNDNVQAVLTRIVSDQFEDSVVPSLTAVVTKNISEQLDGKIGGRVSHSVQNQMQKLLPNAISQALQKPELSKAVADKIASSVSLDMEESFRQTLTNTITPVFSELAVSTSRSVAKDVQRQASEQIEALEQRHLADSSKIDHLTALVTKLSDTVSTMAATQAQFQDSLLKMQQQSAPRERAQAAPAVSSHQSYHSPSANSTNQMVAFPADSPAQPSSEIQNGIASIIPFMDRGDYEAAMIQWLHSDYKREIFDQYIVNFDPGFIHQMPPLVSLSVGTVVAEALADGQVPRKIEWMDNILRSLHRTLPGVNGEIRDLVPNIMEQYRIGLERVQMQISSTRGPNDPYTNHLSNMLRFARGMRDEYQHQQRY